MWFLQFLFSGEASGSATASDTWGRCAQARALSAGGGRGANDHGLAAADDARLADLRRLGWSTVAVPPTANQIQI